MRQYRLVVLRLTAALLLLTPTTAGVEENSTERAKSFNFSSSALPQTVSPADCLSLNHQIQGDVDKCLLGKLSDQAYFGIDPTQVSDQQMLNYINKNREAVAALLLQVDYGRDLKRFVGYQDQILATQNEAAFLQHLQTAQNVAGILGQVADVLNASRQTAAWTAASESLSALGQILFGIQVYQRFADVLISSDLRQALTLYFENRLDTQSARSMTPEAAWNDVWSVYGPVLLSIGQAKGMSTDQLSKWFENAFVAYRLVGYSDSQTVRYAQGQALVSIGKAAKEGTAKTSRQVVVASFQSVRRAGTILVPFLIYDGGRYVPLPRGVIDPTLLNFPQQDLLPNGGVNPSSAKVSNAIQQSVLNTFKDFDVYRDSIKIGQFTVTRVSVNYFGGGISDAEFKVVGSGIAKGFEPQGDLAVAGRTSLRDFSCSGLTQIQARQARSLALGLIPRAMPRLPSWPETLGEAILLGDPDRETMNCYDLRRDGITEVSLELRIAFKSPKGKPDERGQTAQFSADVYLFAQYERTAGTLTALLSSVRIYGEGSAESYSQGSGVSRLMGALDIDGDGVGELVVAGAEGNWIRAYKPTRTGLLLLCEIRNYWNLVDY
jgi:hypothetical protein